MWAPRMASRVNHRAMTASLIDVSVTENSLSPTDVVPADAIEVELLDANGTVLATVRKEAAMVWSKPKDP